jgi:hypothetical protein
MRLSTACYAFVFAVFLFDAAMLMFQRRARRASNARFERQMDELKSRLNEI